jgi:hypothetical protein
LRHLPDIERLEEEGLLGSSQNLFQNLL